MSTGDYKISYKNDAGIITFDYDEEEDTVDNIQVMLPGKQAAIKKYFNTIREYQIPESQQIDDYRVDKAKPVDSLTYFRLAVSTLHTNTGVWVGSPATNPDNQPINK